MADRLTDVLTAFIERGGIVHTSSYSLKVDCLTVWLWEIVEDVYWFVYFFYNLMSYTQQDQRQQPWQQLCEAVCVMSRAKLFSFSSLISDFRGFDLPISSAEKKSWNVGHPGWHGDLRFSCKCVVGCTGPTGGASESAIQEAGLGYKNDEKKTRPSWSAAARSSVWVRPSLAPSGSHSSFTAHQTWLCLLDTGAPDQTFIVIFFFLSHQVVLFERKDRRTGAYYDS